MESGEEVVNSSIALMFPHVGVRGAGKQEGELKIGSCFAPSRRFGLLAITCSIAVPCPEAFPP
jgi:hypothetical protein